MSNNGLPPETDKELMEIAGSKDITPETKVKLMKRLLNDNGYHDVQVGYGKTASKKQEPPVGLKKTLKKYQWVGILVVVGFFAYLGFTNLTALLSIVIFVGIVGGYGYYEIKRSKKRKEQKAKK